jgi:AcrR family transcriptional regulator
VPPGTRATQSMTSSASPKTRSVASEQNLPVLKLPACSADGQPTRSSQTADDRRHQGHGTPKARQRRTGRDLHARAIARHLAMTASAVHYYFPSRQALLDALIVDGFTCLAEALQTTCEGVGPRPRHEQWLAVCRAHRAWALGHQAEYLLLYGHDGACAVKQRNPKSIKPSQVSSTSCSRSCGALSPPARSTRNASKRHTGIPAQPARHVAQRERRGRRPSRRHPRRVHDHLRPAARCHHLKLVAHVPLALADRGTLFDLEMVHAYAALVYSPSPDDIAERAQGPSLRNGSSSGTPFPMIQETGP